MISVTSSDLRFSRLSCNLFVLTIAVVVMTALLLVPQVSAQTVSPLTYIQQTIGPSTGLISPYGNNCGSSGNCASLTTSNLFGTAVDPQGNVYFGDYSTYVIYKYVPSTGNLSIFMPNITGSVCTGGSSHGDMCPLSYAKTIKNYDIAFDFAGNMYIGDNGNKAIHVVYNSTANTGLTAILEAEYGTSFNGFTTPQIGYLYMIAGGGASATGTLPFTVGNACAASGAGSSLKAVDTYGDGCLATNIYQLTSSSPRGLSVDGFGNIYFTDYTPGIERMIAAHSMTIAGAGGTGGSSTSLAVTPGMVVAIAGGGTIGGGTAATINGSCGTGGPTILDEAGDGCYGYQLLLTTDPWGIAADNSGNVYFVDYTAFQGVSGGTTTVGQGLVRKLTPNYKTDGSSGSNVIYYTSSDYMGMPPGLNSTYCSNAIDSVGDGCNRLLANPYKPRGLTLDQAGNLYVTDYTNNMIRKVDAQTGIVTPILGSKKLTANTTVGAYCATTVVGSTVTSAGSGATAIDKYGKGCLGIEAYLNTYGNVAVDAQGNVWIADYTNGIIREAAQNPTVPQTAVGNTSGSQLIGVGLIADSPATTSPFTPSNGELTIGTGASSPLCIGTGQTLVGPLSGYNSPLTVCQLEVTFSPAATGGRSLAINVLDTQSTPVTTSLGVTGTATGASMAIDPAYVVTVGTGLSSPAGVAIDTAGNRYISDSANNRILEVSSGGTQTVIGSGSYTPAALVHASNGNLYFIDSATGNLDELPYTSATYTSAVVLSTGVFSSPGGLALDPGGNLWVADTGHSRILIYPYDPGTGTLNASNYRVFNPAAYLTAGVYVTLGSPTSIAIDANWNIYVVDSSLSGIVKFAANSGYTYLSQGPAGVTGIALDSADNLYFTQNTSVSILPVGSSTTFALNSTSFTTAAAIVADGSANLTIADTGKSKVFNLQRTTPQINFGSVNSGSSGVATATLSSAGTSSLTLGSASPFWAISGTNASDFVGSLSGVSSPCSSSEVLALGTYCSIEVTFTPTGTGTEVASLIPTSTSVITPTLSLTGGAGSLPTTTTTITFNPASITYGASDTVTATVTTSGSGTPTGTITFSVDGTAGSPITMVSGAAQTTLSGLTAGSHTILAAYSGDGSNGSSNASKSLTVAQASTTTSLGINPTVAALTQPVTMTATITPSTATGTVTFKNGATSLGTASVSSGTAVLVTTSLNGTYNVTATYGGDTNFTGSTSGSVAVVAGTAATTAQLTSYTSGPLGAGVLVASDGSGQYTTVGAAVAALPSGGTIYIKPGTYNERVVITAPNLSIIGLGTSPSQVVITDNLGAANTGSDETSATMDVTRTSTNFYLNNVQLVNNYIWSGSQNQALALWVNADRAVISNVNLIGEQDTLYAGAYGCGTGYCTVSRQYFVNDFVEGNVDYVFGNGTTVFDHSSFYTLYHTSASGETTITAQNKSNSGDANGFVFTNDTLTAESDSGAQTNLYLGRPWGAYSTTVFMNTYMNAPIAPAGWVEFTPGTTDNLPTSYYAEFNSYGTGAAGTRESYAVQLSGAQTASWQPATWLAGSDSWNPTFTPSIKTLQPLTLIATPLPSYGLGAPTGSVTFTVDSVAQTPITLSNGTASLTIGAGALSVGSHSVSYIYSGDSNYSGSTSTTGSVSVATVSTTSSVSTSASSGAPGASVTLTATVVGAPGTNPTGTVTFYSNGTSIGNGPVSASGSAGGVATLAWTLPSVGSYSITATYSGDSNYAPSTASAITETVAYASSSTSLSTSASSVVPGQAVTLTATVSGSGATPTGTVTFSATSTGASQGVLGTVALVNGVSVYNGLVWGGTDTITATYNGNSYYSSSTSNSVTVSNAPVKGVLTLNWPYINWGQAVSYGGSSGAWPVVLQNLTGVTVATPTLNFSGAGAANFTITGNTCVSSLAQGASCGFNVVFTPMTGGSPAGSSTSATLSVSTSTSSSYTVTLPVSGIAVSSGLTFNWPFLNFTPTVAVGSSSTPWPVTLTNQSGTSTTINSISFSDGSFTLGTDNCTGNTLGAGASCIFNVVFTPLVADIQHSGTNVLSGTMTASGNSGAVTGSLTVGGWAASALGFNWPFVNFQPQSVGSTGTNLWPVTVTNYSGQALTGLTYTFTGVSNYQTGAFTLTNTCSSLAAGASCTFDVAPSPVSGQSGAYSATLVVSGNGLSSYALTVSGNAIAASGFSINWNQDQQAGVSTIDFGPQNVENATAGPWPITVYNNTTSTQDLTLSPSLSVFTTGQSNCTGVPIGGSCSFNLYFTPTALQVYQGTLTITGSVSGSYTFNTWGQSNH